jgi:serine/threonine protein phosphatase PrpC
MEDAHTVHARFMEHDSLGFFAIYDGHGSDEAAKLASDILHGILARQLALTDPASAFKAAVAEADKLMQAQEFLFVGCTATTCLVVRDLAALPHLPRGSEDLIGPQGTVFFANVGDSRCVLAETCDESASVSFATADHKASAPAEVQRIRAAGGFVSFGRVNGILSVARALGDHGLKQFVVSDPEVTQVPLTDASRFIILACDGVWDVMTSDEASQIAWDAYRPHRSAQAAAEAIKDTAMRRRTRDNVSALVVVL